MNGNKRFYFRGFAANLLQIAPWRNGPFRSEGPRERAVDRHCAHRRCAYAPLAQLLREGDREEEGGYVRGEGKTGALRPPKVKSRDGEGPSGDRALQDAKSKREVKHVCSPLGAIRRESLVSLKQSM